MSLFGGIAFWAGEAASSRPAGRPEWLWCLQKARRPVSGPEEWRNTAVGVEVRQGTEQDRLALQVQLRTLDFILNEMRSLLGKF